MAITRSMCAGETPVKVSGKNSTLDEARAEELLRARKARRAEVRQARRAQLRQARNREKKSMWEKAVARLGAVVPTRFFTTRKENALPAMSIAAMRYIYAVTGEPSTAEARYQEHISAFGILNGKKSVRALANLIPGLQNRDFERLKTLRAAYEYMSSLQTVQQRPEESKTTKTKEVPCKKTVQQKPEESKTSKTKELSHKMGRGERHTVHGDNNDEVEYLLTYDESKRARLPGPKVRTEVAVRVKVEEARAISKSDKYYISVSLGRMKSRSLGEASTIVERNAPECFDAFMDGNFPDIGILPNEVVEELQKFAYVRTPPKSLRSMISIKAKEESQEEEVTMDVADQDNGTSTEFNGAQLATLRKGGRTAYMIIDSMRHEIKGLQAALRACGKEQDDVEEFLSKITRGKTINKSLVEMGWKAD